MRSRHSVCSVVQGRNARRSIRTFAGIIALGTGVTALDGSFSGGGRRLKQVCTGVAMTSGRLTTHDASCGSCATFLGIGCTGIGHTVGSDSILVSFASFGNSSGGQRCTMCMVGGVRGCPLLVSLFARRSMSSLLNNGDVSRLCGRDISRGVFHLY